MSINPPQSFDWTARNLPKVFIEWLEEVDLFFGISEIQRWKAKTYAAKTENVVKKKNSLFIF